ncbi:SpoVR family protein [Thiohalorhabdus denitrificans]|uniref:Stage V sporulation protein R n=2 Tax=Thiohalorhabdus denitrificans TaxID=381306 RepID=A0A1G5GW61_9GAMM|nr:SpoVR family protein [Thiohalorhabdus denitrificans]SCY55724.1 stage V sporulation protein R [Thiohalorhabdus denitrificans]
MPFGPKSPMSNAELVEYTPKLEELAQSQGLDFYPVDFEVVPPSFMMEVAVYGLPVRMPHWSFGVRYIYQYIQHRMGGSRIFEVVFPGNPNRAYLVNNNSLPENTLVTAHVLGHADFSKNNELFARMQSQVGYHIVEQAAERAHRIDGAIDEYGQKRVEAVLDAALALEQNIDINFPINRPGFPERMERRRGEETGSKSGFQGRFGELPGEAEELDTEGGGGSVRAPIPPRPEYDLLWFIAHYAPDLEGWEQDIFLSVREESFYFYPVFACQIMNEGWASYWHARLLREADFLPQQLYLDAIKAHSDVVRPYAGEKSVSLSVNPYHLGFHMWERIIAEHGLETALQLRAEEDDFSFVRNWLDEDLAEELQLFSYTTRRGRGGEEQYVIQDRDIHALREAILHPKFNYGAPRVYVSEMGTDGGLLLQHDHQTDGKGLDLDRAQKVLEYIQRVWRRPVQMVTVDGKGREQVLERD